MSKIEVDAIDKQSGSTLTLGGSGTAVTLACGATQSGLVEQGLLIGIQHQKQLHLLQYLEMDFLQIQQVQLLI